jgi:hypothetical protein
MSKLAPYRALILFAVLALALSACVLTSPVVTATPPPSATFVQQIIVVSPTPAAGVLLTPTIGAVAPTWTPSVVTVPQVNLPDVSVQTQGTTADVTTFQSPVYVIPANCTVRSDWQPYTIQAGDTIGVLAINTSTAIEDIVIGNCLTNPDIIEVGQVVYVPRQPSNFVQPVAAAAVAVASTPLPNVTQTDTTQPAIGFVLVEPALVEGGRFLVAPGTITIRAQGVSNAASVNFFMSPIGTTAQPTLLGTDDNMADGAIIQWTLSNTPLQANFWAVATSPGGLQVSTDPILVSNNG